MQLPACLGIVTLPMRDNVLTLSDTAAVVEDLLLQVNAPCIVLVSTFPQIRCFIVRGLLPKSVLLTINVRNLRLI